MGTHPLEAVYSSVSLKGGLLSAYNMATGYIDTIDYETGTVTSRLFAK